MHTTYYCSYKISNKAAKIAMPHPGVCEALISESMPASELLLPVDPGALVVTVPVPAPATVVVAAEPPLAEFPSPLPLPLPGAATATVVTAPRFHVNDAPLKGAVIVPLPAVFDNGSVPFAGRWFGSTHVALLFQPGDVKPRLPVQSIESSDEAHDERAETWIRLLKNDSWEGSVFGQIL
jgi:hypothetical protein